VDYHPLPPIGVFTTQLPRPIRGTHPERHPHRPHHALSLETPLHLPPHHFHTSPRQSPPCDLLYDPVHLFSELFGKYLGEEVPRLQGVSAEGVDV